MCRPASSQYGENIFTQAKQLKADKWPVSAVYIYMQTWTLFPLCLFVFGHFWASPTSRTLKDTIIWIMEHVLKHLTESVHEGLRKSAGDPSCLLTVDFMVGCPQRLWTYKNYTSKSARVWQKDWVRQTLKGRRKKRDVEIERDAFESTTHAHTNTQWLINYNISLIDFTVQGDIVN